MLGRMRVDISHSGTILIGRSISADGPSERKIQFVSHAHTDHIGGLKKKAIQKQTVVCTAPTLELATELLHHQPPDAAILEYRKPREFEGESVELYPANHILGSAQLLVESKEGTLAYTGDFKQPGTAIVSSDSLVIEATYGAPIYQRQAGDGEVAFIETVEKCLREGPLAVYAYAAKVQEALQILSNIVEAEFFLDQSCLKIAKIYAKHGVKLPKYSCLSDQEIMTLQKGDRAVMFRAFGRQRERLRHQRIILSGWAPEVVSKIDGGFMVRLSDHADFNQLINYVEEARPRQVYTDASRSSYAGVLAKAIEARLRVPAKALPAR